MTIAAGFKFKDVILLCADREITEGISKFSESKLFGEQIGPDVSLIFTLAGAMDYAEMAIQEIIAAVKSSQFTTHADIRAAMSDTVRDIYSEAIGGLLQTPQTEAGFGLLLGVWAEGQLKLYASEDTAVKQGSSIPLHWDREGIGEIRPQPRRGSWIGSHVSGKPPKLLR